MIYKRFLRAETLIKIFCKFQLLLKICCSFGFKKKFLNSNHSASWRSYGKQRCYGNFVLIFYSIIISKNISLFFLKKDWLHSDQFGKNIAMCLCLLETAPTLGQSWRKLTENLDEHTINIGKVELTPIFFLAQTFDLQQFFCPLSYKNAQYLISNS